MFVLRLTDPEVDVVQEEASQNLVQSPVHLQAGGSSHQPLQQLLQLCGHMLRKKRGKQSESVQLKVKDD